MPSLPQLPSAIDDYAPPPGTVWNPAAYTATIVHMAARIRAVEAVGTTLEDIIAELQVFGLQRLDEAIVPLIEAQQAELAALQAEIAAALAATQVLVDNFQDATAAALADLQTQIDASLLVIENNIGALQDQVDLILAGGLSADDVVETATRVFVTPAQRTQIDAIATTLADFTTATNALLASYEPKWGTPAAYNGAALLDRQHILATSAFSLDLVTTTAAVGDRFRITQIGTGFVVTLNGTGVRFRNAAGAWVTEAFTIDASNVTHEFVKVTSTDWEQL